MNHIELEKFIICVIDDKAVQIQFLRLSDKEAKHMWESLLHNINKIYEFSNIPDSIQVAFDRYIK